ncbi:hypothetical protein GTS_00210 [Gandjariella thermophila]|uniref:Thioesterase domain-containing protein n=1 Tax=Gandjariella thermophila TaxID=1931992 RepID=A0A4D4J0R0_9PSEU|nr:hypothetical protein GTS_00210 [Gandjariella thermophila]
MCAVLPPGRERRLDEQPLTAIGAMVDRLVPVLARWLDRPPVFFGHSMGALLAFETAGALAARGKVPPRLLVLSGRRPPDRPDDQPPIHDLPTEEFVAGLLKLGGTPREVVEHPELLDLLLPVLRADVRAVETYHYRPRPPLACPIVAFGGTDDERASVAELAGWERHTSGGCRVRAFSGGHFFAYEHPDVLPALRDELRPVSGR